MNGCVSWDDNLYQGKVVSTICMVCGAAIPWESREATCDSPITGAELSVIHKDAMKSHIEGCKGEDDGLFKAERTSTHK